MSDWGGPNRPKPAAKKRARWRIIFVVLAVLLGLIALAIAFWTLVEAPPPDIPHTGSPPAVDGTDWDGPRAPLE